jgi:hypothetical protein
MFPENWLMMAVSGKPGSLREMFLGKLANDGTGFRKN